MDTKQNSLPVAPAIAQPASPSRASLRRARRAATRRTQILEAAGRVFAEKGYHRATTKEIARAADVSEGTLYNYFGSKRELFIGLLKLRTESLMQAINQIQADSAEEMVMHLLAGQFLEMRQRRHLRLFLHEAMLDAELGDYLREQVFTPLIAVAVQRMRSLIELGIMRPVDPAVASWTLIGAVIGLTFFTDVGAAPALEAMSPEVLAAQVSDVFLNGLRAAPRP